MTMTAEELRRAARAMTAALLDKWESKHALDAAQHQGRREDVARARERFRAAAASCGDVDDFPALGAWVAVRSADIAAAEALLDAVVIPVIRERFRALRLRGAASRDAENGVVRRTRAALLRAPAGTNESDLFISSIAVAPAPAASVATQQEDGGAVTAADARLAAARARTAAAIERLHSVAEELGAVNGALLTLAVAGGAAEGGAETPWGATVPGELLASISDIGAVVLRLHRAAAQLQAPAQTTEGSAAASGRVSWADEREGARTLESTALPSPCSMTAASPALGVLNIHGNPSPAAARTENGGAGAPPAAEKGQPQRLVTVMATPRTSGRQRRPLLLPDMMYTGTVH
jgi:hypothetical protein